MTLGLSQRNRIVRSAGEAYAELIRRTREAALLDSCGAVLHWDQRTYMPSKGSGHRAEQLALLAGMVHQQVTAPEIGELLSAVEQSDLIREAGSPAAVNVREIRRTYDRAIKVPEALVKELARTCALARDVWVEARRRSDFAVFCPWLEKVVALKRQEADAVGYAAVRYDALLDAYEPGETTARIGGLFVELKSGLIPLVQAVGTSGRRPDISILHREYPPDGQEAFGKAAAAAIGFDFAGGRLDVTTHPFCCGIGPGDTRLTTRYDPQDFGDAFFSILHEAGHGLYDQGLDPAHYGTPMGAAVSLGIHESQSRLWENFVGRSRSFWEHFYPRLRQAFPDALGEVSLHAFYAAINDVRPSFIRVDADEATYNLHIILRFELEQSLVSGDLQARDVPAAWNESFRRIFGLIPPDDATGCLQDTHWSEGGIGYFPTYTLGNMYAAQFFARAQAELGDLEAMFRAGEFAPLREWLTAKIYRQGQRSRAADLVATVTGNPLSPRPLLSYLQEKFSALYGI
jgi:carboxypeptidase Taq